MTITDAILCDFKAYDGPLRLHFKGLKAYEELWDHKKISWSDEGKELHYLQSEAC